MHEEEEEEEQVYPLIHGYGYCRKKGRNNKGGESMITHMAMDIVEGKEKTTVEDNLNTVGQVYNINNGVCPGHGDGRLASCQDLLGR
jgi:hypothetical protein